MFCRRGIEGNGDKDEYREAEQRGASVADKRKGNTGVWYGIGNYRNIN